MTPLALMPNVTPGASSPAAPARAEVDCTDKANGFAQCMTEAQQHTQAAPPSEASALDAPAFDPPHDAATAAAELSTTPDLAALLPGWTGVPAPAAAGVAADEAALGSAPVPALDAHGTAGKAPHTGIAADTASAQRATAAAAPQALPQPGADAAAPARARDASAPAADEPHPPRADQAPAGTPLQPAGAAAAAAAPTRTAQPTPMAHLPAPIDAPGFAPALAAQVRWWAQDGVQQAQLTLSPPQMGPVAVKIVVLDQREARIDFVADVAATRAALEAALPVLAAALDEGGLKLTGGGVHDGAAQRQALWQQAQQGAAARAATPVSAAASAGTRPDAAGRAPGARGLVDLVA